MVKVRPATIKVRKPGRPRAVPEGFEQEMVGLYERGYGYRSIARILNSREHGSNAHFSSIRKTLIRLGKVEGK